MKNETWFEKVKELATVHGWAVENVSTEQQLRVAFRRSVSKGLDYRFEVEVGDGSLRCVDLALHRFIDGFDVHESSLLLPVNFRRVVGGMLAVLWHAFRHAEEGCLHTPSTRKTRVCLTVSLEVQVKDGHPALTVEDLESVLCDMDYRFTPSEDHQASGVVFNEHATEILEWEYSV